MPGVCKQLSSSLKGTLITRGRRVAVMRPHGGLLKVMFVQSSSLVAF